MRRHLVAFTAALVVFAGGAGAAVAKAPPRLTAHGPTAVSGTDASAVFRIADRTIRQVRYRDRGTLAYRFTLANDGDVPVTVTGLAPMAHEPRLFHPVSVSGPGGSTRFEVPSGGHVTVWLRMRMSGCETLSARAGSFLTSMVLRTTRMGVIHQDVAVVLPEEVHTGSPREAFCPNSTATSRPPG